MKIFLLGDSLSQGIIFDKARARLALTRDSFYNLVKPMLSGEVINLSKLGRTISEARKALEQKLLNTRPDAVAIELGGNDCDFDWEEVAKAPYAEHICKTPFEQFESGIREMVVKLKSEGIIPVLMNLPPIDADRYFHHFCHNDIEMERSVLKFLGNVTRIYWWHERFSSVVGQIAEDTGAKFIDVRRGFLYKHDFREYLCDDGIHPNAAGHGIIAERIEDFVKKNFSFVLAGASI